MQKAQGTIEYLVILAIIVVISLVVVTLMSNSISSTSAVSKAQSELYWAAQPISIIDATVDSDGDAFFILQPKETFTITQIKIDDSLIDIDSKKIFANNKKGILFEGLIPCVGQEGTYIIYGIYGVNENGLPVTISSAPIIVTCSNDISKGTINVDDYIDATVPRNIAFAYSEGYDSFGDLTIDSSGYVYVLGTSYNGPIFFDEDVVVSETDHRSFVAKLDKDTNNWLWAISIPSDYATGLVTDSFGNVYFSYESTENSYAYITKVDSSGNLIWEEEFQYGWINDIDIGSDNNLYITGTFGDLGLTLGDFELTSNGINEIFIAKMSPSKEYFWANSAGGVNYDMAYALVVGNDQNVYLFGEYGGYGNFGSINKINLGGFVAKANSQTGEWVWATITGGGLFEQWGDIANDSQNNLYITSAITNSEPTVFGDVQLNTTSFWQAFVAKINSNGEWVWATKVGSDVSLGLGIAISQDNYVYSAGLGDERGAFFTKLNKDTNEIIWDNLFPGVDQFNSITMSSTNKPFLTGVIDGTQDFEGTTIHSIGYVDAFIWRVNNVN